MRDVPNAFAANAGAAASDAAADDAGSGAAARLFASTRPFASTSHSTPYASPYPNPYGYRVEGAGSAEADGLYVRDGEYGGAPLFKKVSPTLALTPAPTLTRFLALALPLTLSLT